MKHWLTKPQNWAFQQKLACFLRFFLCFSYGQLYLFSAVRAPKTDQHTEQQLCFSISSEILVFVFLVHLQHHNSLFFLIYQTSWNVPLNFPVFSSLLPPPPFFATEQREIVKRRIFLIFPVLPSKTLKAAFLQYLRRHRHLKV